MGKEIERKFLVNNIPLGLERYTPHEISQGYIPSDNPEIERRVRKKDDKYFYTEKGEGNLSRDEKEEEISRAKFEIFWRSTEGRRVEKIRYEIPFSGKIIELDIYTGNLEGLLIAEIEFASVEEARNFSLPNWFGKEVTDDKRYKNRNLAINGVPN